MSEEEWRDAHGYEGLYEVSNLGRVRRSPLAKMMPGKILSLAGRLDNNGYPQSSFYRHCKRTTKKIHVLVAHAFLGPRPPGLQVNHKDGNKQNNALSNLEYVTNRENALHAIRLGLYDPSAGGRLSAGKGYKLTATDVAEIRNRAASGERRQVLADQFGVNVMTIGEIVRREIWRSVA